MSPLIKYLHDWFRYFTTWSCPAKRSFFFGLLAIDMPVIGFDYTFVVYFADILDVMVGFFRGDLGKLIQYGVGVLAMWLTWERIKQAKYVSQQMKNQPPPPSKDE